MNGNGNHSDWCHRGIFSFPNKKNQYCCFNVLLGNSWHECFVNSVWLLQPVLLLHNWNVSHYNCYSVSFHSSVSLLNCQSANYHNYFLNLYRLVGSTCGKSLSVTPQGISVDKFGCLDPQDRSIVLKVKSSKTREGTAMFDSNTTRRDFLGVTLVSGLFLNSLDAKGAGLPPEEKPRLCDDTCERELENVWWDYTVPFSSLFLYFTC